MNKNPNNNPRKRVSQDKTEHTKVYRSERPMNTNNYVTDTTKIMPTIKNNQKNPNHTHDPNQLYKQPIPKISDDATKLIPKVKPQQTNGNMRTAKPNPPKQITDNEMTRVIPTVPQNNKPNPQRNNTGNQPVVRRKPQDTGQRPVAVRQRGTNTSNTRNININRKRKSVPANENSAPTMISNIMKAVIYIVAVIVVSLFMAVYIIFISNDIFAFVKSDMEVDITISDYDNASDIAKKLYDFGIIKYPSIFRLYAKLRDYGDSYTGGTYTVSPSMNYDQLNMELEGRNVKREEISVTIREGWTVDEIIDLFVSKGMGTKAKFVDVINNYEFDFWFVEELINLPLSRTYRLEGYLFPDTYRFYTDSSEIAIIYKFLENFNRKFVPEYREYVANSKYTVDEMITLASMIQAEARYTDEYGKISSVFHNRMNNPTREAMGFLQSDATIQYVISQRTENLTVEDMNINNEYNTYLYKGLPPGPIGNPSLNAIHFALDPEDTDYFYFVSYPGGRTEFQVTLAEHNEMKNIIRSSQ